MLRRVPLFALIAAVLVCTAASAQFGADDADRFEMPGSISLEEAHIKTDRIALEPNIERRVELAKQFLADHPDNYWRHAAYRIWLSSAWRLRDKAELDKAAEAYLAEFADSPECMGAVSRYLLEADYRIEDGFEYAQRSVELYAIILGVDGSAESLTRANSDSIEAGWPDAHQPPSGRALFHEYLGSRFNYARYLLRRSSPVAALNQVLPVIELKPFQAYEPQTLAPFLVIAGEAKLRQSEDEEAYAYFLRAAVAGDESGRYLLLAERRIAELEDSLRLRQQRDVYETIAAETLGGLLPPVFEDLTFFSGLTGFEAGHLAWGDVNGDGMADLLLDGLKLFNNQLGRRFIESDERLGLATRASFGMFADIDGDTDLDLYTAGEGSARDRIFRNEDGNLIDITTFAGSIDDGEANSSACWLDFNADGFPDLITSGDTSSTALTIRESNGRGVFLISGTGYELPGNSGGSALIPLSLGVEPNSLFVAQPGAANMLLANLEDDGGHYFEDAGSVLGMPGIDDALISISAAANFTAGNGSLSLLVLNSPSSSFSQASASQFYFRAGGTDSVEIGLVSLAEAGIKQASRPTHVLSEDFNCDGLTDLLILSAGGASRAQLYLQQPNGGFVDATYFSGLRILDGRHAAWADFDRDGDIDLACATGGGIRIYRNNTDPARWVQVLAPTGSKVTLRAGSTYTREILSAEQMSNEQVACFAVPAGAAGLGLEVIFPDGSRKRLPVARTNERLVVYPDSESEGPEAPEIIDDEDDDEPAVVRPENGNRSGFLP